MSDEYENKSSYQAQSSETISGNGSGVSPDMDYVRPAENPEQDLYHAHSFIAVSYTHLTLPTICSV